VRACVRACVCVCVCVCVCAHARARGARGGGEPVFHARRHELWVNPENLNPKFARLPEQREFTYSAYLVAAGHL